MNVHDQLTINRAIKELTNEDTIIAAIPGSVTNSGKQIEALSVSVHFKPNQKEIKFLYRGLPGDFKRALVEAIEFCKVAGTDKQEKNPLFL